MITDASWTQEDAVIARGIFRTATWGKMVEILRMVGPTISTKSLEQLAFSGLAKDTWEKCLNAFAKFEQEVVEEENFADQQIDISTLGGRSRRVAEEEVHVAATPVPPPNGSKTQD